MTGRQTSRRKYLLDDGKRGREKVKGRQERRHKHLLDDLKVMI